MAKKTLLLKMDSTLHTHFKKCCEINKTKMTKVLNKAVEEFISETIINQLKITVDNDVNIG